MREVLPGTWDSLGESPEVFKEEDNWWVGKAGSVGGANFCIRSCKREHSAREIRVMFPSVCTSTASENARDPPKL